MKWPGPLYHCHNYQHHCHGRFWDTEVLTDCWDFSQCGCSSWVDPERWDPISRGHRSMNHHCLCTINDNHGMISDQIMNKWLDWLSDCLMPIVLAAEKTKFLTFQFCILYLLTNLIFLLLFLPGLEEVASCWLFPIFV